MIFIIAMSFSVSGEYQSHQFTSNISRYQIWYIISIRMHSGGKVYLHSLIYNVSMILSAVRSSSPRWGIHRPEISRKSSSRGALHKFVSDYYRGDRASRCIQINKAWNNIGVTSLGSRAGWWPLADRVINNREIGSGSSIGRAERGTAAVTGKRYWTDGFRY